MLPNINVVLETLQVHSNSFYVGLNRDFTTENRLFVIGGGVAQTSSPGRGTAVRFRDC